MAKCFTIKIVDANGRLNDEFVVNNLHSVGQIFGNLHGKYYNHYGKYYMKWISASVVYPNGNVDYVYNFVDYSAKCYDKYYSKKG